MSQPRTSDQREALKQSEEAASRSHPENFKDEENESKQVEIPPIEPEGTNIQGLDPEEE